jgi:pullulanase/glycogen debranching enzyme
VTHVELLPVMAFDEQDVPPAVAAGGLRNYWGYSTHSFWSPHPGYCVDPARAPHELRALTDALQPPWHHTQARLLRFTLAGLVPGEEDLHVVLNMSEQAVDVALPSIRGRQWHIAIATANASPLDIAARPRQRPHRNSSYFVRARSVAVLEARG